MFIILLILFLVLLPFINRIVIIPIQLSQEIDLLNKLVELDKLSPTSKEEIALRTKITADVNNLVEEKNITFNPVELYIANPAKFYSGISIWVVVFILLIFQKNKISAKVGALIFVILIGISLGYIGLLIPDIFSPWVNYIGFPIIQIIFIFSLLKADSKQTGSSSNESVKEDLPQLSHK